MLSIAGGRIKKLFRQTSTDVQSGPDAASAFRMALAKSSPHSASTLLAVDQSMGQWQPKKAPPQPIEVRVRIEEGGCLVSWSYTSSRT